MENGPRRIVIIGSGGSGKTVLANRLGRRLGLPVTHLDEMLHDRNWTRLPAAEFVRRQEALVAGPAWIVEGTYPRTMPIRLAAADTVILLDLPTAVCLLSVVRRRLRYGRGQHADGVFASASPRFFRHVTLFRRQIRPGLLRIIEKHGKGRRIVRLTSRRQVDAYVSALSGTSCEIVAEGQATGAAGDDGWTSTRSSTAGR